LASGAKFIARSADRFASHLQEVFIRSKNHNGTSFIEVLQNCPIFNDGIFDIYTQKDRSKNNIIFLEEGKPIVFGPNNDLTMVIDNLKPKIAKLSEVSENDLWIHDKENKQKALILSQLGFEEFSNFPLPFGIIFENNQKKSKTTKKIQLNDIQLVNIIKNQSFEIN
jgi:2-oxoglutarate ferredoxin oxidoreductase subunit beta